MRRTVGIGLGVILAAATLGMWIVSSPNDVTSTESVAVKGSGTPMLPVELMRKAGKDLPDGTPREPF